MSTPSIAVTSDPRHAARALRRGGLVGVPTETVYGLAADATQPAAIGRVFTVKGRPNDHPLILHLGDAGDLGAWVTRVPPVAATLAEACWPGPLTLLLERGVRVPDEVTGGRDSVAVRVPAHRSALAMLAELGTPVVAPSANRFGSVSPTRARHVTEELGEHLDPTTDVVLDGGECPVGIESTIVDCTRGDAPRLLRPGGISLDDLESLVGHVEPPPTPSSTTSARASGMLPSHYAPRARVVLTDSLGGARAELDRLQDGGERTELLDIADVTDLVAYARDLYAALRRADERQVDVVIAVLPSPHGLGFAIRDRLGKAAADR